MAERFENKVALITGAGSGMGRAIAIRLAAEGASVLAVDIDGERLEETKGLSSGTLTVHQTDLSAPDACADAVRVCVDNFGRLDILGNVAGIYLAEHMAKVTVEQYRRVMSVNLDAYFFLSQAALPHLLEAGGNIVNISSNSGLQGVPYSIVYSMTKGGVIQLTRSMAIEFIKSSLRVNAIAPAGTNTNIATGVQFPSDIDLDLVGRMSGHRGMAEPEEVAALFAFLASDEARSVTGSVYTLDNGLTAS